MTFDRSRIVNQRCVRIHKLQLDVFLVKINSSKNEASHYEAEYIFANGKNYDVVVSERGSSYPYMFDGILEFAKRLNEAASF